MDGGCDTCKHSWGETKCRGCLWDGKTQRNTHWEPQEPFINKPCEDCISRQAVLSEIETVCFSKEEEWIKFRADYGSNGERDLIINYIKHLPSVQPEQKTGRWILTDDDFVYCSECEDSYYPRPIDASWYFCPHCGAKMVEGEE